MYIVISMGLGFSVSRDGKEETLQQRQQHEKK